jgi:protoporphyrinogen oxidase
LVRWHLEHLGWIQEAQVLDACVMRLCHAYPVLERGIEAKVEKLMAFLGNFQNLKHSGRNATFQHCSMHDVMRQGEEIIASLAKGT